MKRTMLGAGVLLLVAACGASGGGTIQGTTIPAGQQVKAPVVEPAQSARPISAPAQSPPAPRATQAPAPQPASPPAPAQPAASAPPAAGSGPAEGDGRPPCPMGSPPLHRLCPERPLP